MPPKQKGKARAATSTLPHMAPSQPSHSPTNTLPQPALPEGGPARRTRAATRSPQKAQPPPHRTPRRGITRPVAKPAALVSPVRAAGAQRTSRNAPSKPAAAATPDSDNVSGEDDGDDDLESSPYRVPFRIRRPIRVPDGLVGFSQARSDEILLEEGEPFMPVDDDNEISNARPGLEQLLEYHSSDLSDDDELERTKSYDDPETSTRLAIPILQGNHNLDIELYQDGSDGENPDGYLDLSPVIKAARAARSTAAPSSPSAARAVRQASALQRFHQRLPGLRTQQEAQAEATAIVNAAQDILDSHRAKKRRKAPNLENLAAVANQLRPSGVGAPHNTANPARRSVIPPTAYGAANGRNPLPRPATHAAPAPQTRPNAPAGFQNQPNALAGPSNRPSAVTRPVLNRRVGSDPIPATIADAARQLNAEADYEELADTRKRKRTSNPAPHHINSRTPNTRIVLRKGKEDYSFNIVTKNAYPNPHERVAAARAAHDFALDTMPDAASLATGVQWSPSKLRLYGDTGWVRRGLIKAAAVSHIPSNYRLALPPAVAETLPGGATGANTAKFIRSRVEYLFEGGGWMRGRHANHTSLVYANPIFAEILEQAVYRTATTEQRATLSPMPRPALALVATAVQCALEEWQTGIRIRISFTEEMYRRIYQLHLARLERMHNTHRQLLDTLLGSLYDFCVARNEAQPVQQPGLEDELDEIDILNSDMEWDEELQENERDFDILQAYDDA